MFQVSGRIQIAGVLLAALMTWTVPEAKAQLQVGDNLRMNLNGTLAGGYSGTYGDTVIRMTDIRQAEPDPALFLVPPGYSIKEPTETSNMPKIHYTYSKR